MSPQLQHALWRAAFMIVLSALGIFGSEATGILEAAGLDPLLYGGIVAAIISAAVRTVEGKLDSNRAAEGLVQKSDVAFEAVAELAADPKSPQAYFLNQQHSEVRVIPQA